MEVELGPDWDDAHLSFTPEGSTADAAAILAPLAPGRVGRGLRFHVTRDGSSRERLRNLLSRLDSKRVWGTLSLIESTQPMPAAGGPTPRRSSLVNAWDDAVARLARAGATSCASSSSTRPTICRERPFSARR